MSCSDGCFHVRCSPHASVTGGAYLPRVIARGTSDELKGRIGGHRIVITLVDAADSEQARLVLARHGDGEVSVGESGRDLEVPVRSGAPALHGALADLEAAGIRLHDAGVRRPTLDDVFLTLTGHRAEEATT